jgi:hypothetical protein
VRGCKYPKQRLEDREQTAIKTFLPRREKKLEENESRHDFK